MEAGPASHERDGERHGRDGRISVFWGIMTDVTLIVSNPPQREADAQTAAPAFGLSPAEVRMKANYPIPEIWFSHSDERKVTAIAESLRQNGFRVSVATGHDLAAIPRQTSVESFVFTDNGLHLSFGDSELDLAYAARCVAVLCKPRSEHQSGYQRSSTETFRASITQAGSFGAGGTVRSSMDALLSSKEAARTGNSAFLDIYASRDGRAERFTVIQDVVDFSGLPKVFPGKAENMAAFVSEFDERFRTARLDKRLVDMRIRQGPTVSQPQPADGPNRRKGFSYTTVGLAQLLESISDDLKDLGETELASRLAYLTTR